MKNYLLSHCSPRRVLTLAAAIFLLASGQAFAQQKTVTASFSYDAFIGLGGFRLYQNYIPLCETLDITVREMSCLTDIQGGEYAYTLTAFQENGDESGHSEPVLYVYTPPKNTPPVAENQAITTKEDITATHFLAAADAENDPLQFSLSTSPASGLVALNGESGLYTYTPNPDFNGIDQFSYVASDGIADSNEAAVIITVTPVYDAPQAIDDTFQILEDESTALSLLSNDVNKDAGAINLAAISETLQGSAVGIEGNTVLYTPPADFSGQDSFTYSITDGVSTSTAKVFIEVLPVNDRPIVVGSQVKTAEEVSINGNILASDKEGDPLTYHLVSAPVHGSLSLNMNSGEYSYTPSKDFYGTDSFIFKANDGVDDSLTGQITVMIAPVNDAPVASAGPDQTHYEGEKVYLDASNSFDIDSDSLSYFWTQIEGPLVVLSDAAAMQTDFSLDQVDAESVSLRFTVTVSDPEGLSGEDSAIVNITWINDPPIADAGPDQVVFENDPVFLDASQSYDVDDGIASITWNQIAGPAILLENTDQLQTSFTAPDISGDATIALELTIADYGGLQAQDKITINVSWTNEPPVADAGPDQTAITGQLVALNGDASYDSDDGIAGYFWQQVTGPPVTLSSPINALTSFVAPSVTQTTSLVFELTVADFGGLQQTDSLVVDVLPSLPGDLNADGEITVEDQKLFLRVIGACEGDRKFLPEADIDGDLCVSEGDYVLVFGSLPPQNSKRVH